jgi:hypothetical protein
MLKQVLRAIKEVIFLLKAIEENSRNQPAALIRLLEAKPVINEEEKWLQTEDLVAIFKVTSRTIFTWRKSKQLKSTTFGGTVYYLKSDVFEFKKQQLSSGG